MRDRFPRPKKGELFVVLLDGNFRMRMHVPLAAVTPGKRATIHRMMKLAGDLLEPKSRAFDRSLAVRGVSAVFNERVREQALRQRSDAAGGTVDTAKALRVAGRNLTSASRGSARRSARTARA